MIPNQAEIKKKFIEELQNSPIVQCACSKLHVSRATYYRWMQFDKDFHKKINEAIKISTPIVNDLAESTIINRIKDGDLKASTFWLVNHHSVYKNNNMNDSYKINKLKEEMERLKKERDEAIDEEVRMINKLLDGAKMSSRIKNMNDDRIDNVSD